MRVIFNEVKKIFNSKMIFLLIIINLIFYFLFIEFNIKYFPNGRPEKDMYNIHVEMKQKYGPYMDNTEFKDFKNTYNNKLKEANDYIKNHSQFKKCGINSYQEFVAKLEDFDSQAHDEFSKLQNNIFFEQNGVDVFWQLQERRNIIYIYQNKNELMFKKYDGISRDIDNKNKMIKYILSKGHETSVFPETVIQNYNTLITYVTLTIVVGLIFMISQIYIKDKKRKMNYIHYTTKNGRKLFLKKGVAGIIATFIITTIELILFFIMYSKNKTYMFLDCNMNSVFNPKTLWYDITFLQYIIITVICIYILSISFSLISMFISSISNRYITLIGTQLPLVIGFYLFILQSIITQIMDVIFYRWLFPVCYLCIFIIPIILFFIRWKKEKVLDI